MMEILHTQFNWLAVAIFFVATIAFVYVSLGIGSLVRPRKPSQEKFRIYECGEPTIGSAWIRYNIRFYTVALVFLIFDVEAVFLFPIARVFRWFVENSAGKIAFIELLGFVAVLLLALIYAWRFGNLDWLRSGELNAVLSDERARPQKLDPTEAGRPSSQRGVA